MDIAELEVRQGPVSARVAPARGALVTALNVGGHEVLYLDRATLTDPARSVRGGIPLLFPFAGKLKDDHLVHAGTTMKQHGFGRNRAWSVAEQREGFLRLALEDDEAGRSVYPHRFRAEHSFTVLPRGVQIELLMHNTGSTTMPVAPGWHPYFPCPSPQKPQVAPLDVPGLDPARFTPDAEFDFGVTAPATGRARFEVPLLGRLRLEFSPEMRFLQCWSLPGADFICLEPFTGPNDAINTPGRIDIAPGTARALWMRIELD